MSSREIIFLKVFLLFSFLLCSAFIWERISPHGFDVHYKVFTSTEKNKPLIEVSTHISDIAFKDYKHMGAFLMGDWDSIRTPLPKEAMDISVDLSADFYGHPAPEGLSSRPGLIVSQYKGGNLSGEPISSENVPGLKLKKDSLDGPIYIPDANSAFEWSGYLKIEKAGEYLFSLAADDGAFLFIDNVLVLKNKGPHNFIAVNKKISLGEGQHSFSLRYYNIYGRGMLDLKWANLSSIESVGRGSNLKNFSESDFTSQEMGTQIELRSKGDILDYRLESQSIMLFNVDQDGQGKVFVNFPHITDMLDVEFYIRGPDSKFEKSSIFTFSGPTSSFSMLGSILASIFFSLLFTGLVILCSLKLLKASGESSFYYRICCCNIFVIAALARLNNLSNVPGFKYTFDEFMEVWMGINLIELGKPTSWGWVRHIGQYSIIQYLGGPIDYAEYQFHPPPLFGLIVGSWLKMFGVSSIYQYPIFLTRFPSFISSMLVLVLIFCVSARLVNRDIGLLSVLFYAIFPSNVVMNCLVKADNLLCLLAFISIFLLVRGNMRTNWEKFALFLCLTLCPLTKEIGIYLPCVVFVYLVLEKKYKLAVIPILSCLLGIVIYLSYAYYLNWDEFLITIKAIENEGLNINSIGRVMFEHTMYALNYVMLVAWLGLFLFRSNKNYIILLFASVYAIVYGIVSPGNFLYPWHQLCLFPYLAFGYGFLINNSISRFGNRISGMFIALLLLLIVLPFLSEELNFILRNFSSFYRRLCMISIGAFLFSILFLFKKIPKSCYAIYCFLLLMVAYLPFVYILIFKNYA